MDEQGGARPAGVERRTGRDRRRLARHNIDLRLVLSIALGLAAGLLLEQIVSDIIGRLQGLIVTLLISLFLSFALEPAVQWAAQRGMRRGFATMLAFLLTFVLIGVFVAAMTSLVIGQVRNLVEAGPSLLDGLSRQAQDLPGQIGPTVSDWLDRQATSLPDRIPDLAETLGRGALGVGSTLIGGLIQLLTTLLVTFYLVADGPRLRRTLVSRLEPERQREFLQVWELAIRKTGGYVYGRALTAIASAVFHIVAFQFLGVPYATALGAWVGLISSLIPVIGTYIAGALPVVVALADQPIDALWVLAVIVVYQQVENYLVAPRITAATLELHPAVAFVSVLIGAALLGAPGALLALPATAIVAALITAYGERHEVLDHGLLAEHNSEGLGLRLGGAGRGEPRADGGPDAAPAGPDTGE